MKVRNSFVSNSSSSSFIINVDERFPTVKSVAKYIISVIEGYGYQKFDDEKIVLERTSDDTPIYIPSGDDTYIRKVDDKILIATSQNFQFDELNSLSVNDLTDDFIKKFEYYDEDEKQIHEIEHLEDFDYYYQKFRDFLMLNHELYGISDYINDCPNCGFSRAIFLKNGRKICYCQIKKEKLKIKRNQKIKKINRNKT